MKFPVVKLFVCCLALLAALCACAPQGASAAPLPPSSPPAPQSSQTEDAPVDELLSMASIYEHYCSGRSFAGQQNFESCIDFAFGWLRETGLAEPYLDERSRSYDLPQELVAELCRFFLGVDIAPNGERYTLNYAVDYISYSDELSLTARSCEAQGDGWLLTCDRSFNGEALYPVRYTLSPVTVQSPPESTGGLFDSGDTLWRITNVENIYENPSIVVKETRELSMPSDLVNLAERINSGDLQAQQYHYVLACDIDMTGAAMMPIGLNQPIIPYGDHRDPSRAGFNATFDGQGHTIRNLSISVSEPAAADQPLYAGLFGLIGKDGVVQNLTLEQCSVSTPMSWPAQASSMQAGLLAGTIEGAVSNCTVSGTVTGYNSVGGLAGWVGGYDHGGAVVTDCAADNVVVTGSNTVGGFAGMIHGANLERCTVSGEVVAGSEEEAEMPRAIGGFAGHAVAARQLDDCAASVYIRTMVPSGWVGAFMGGCEGLGGVMNRCFYDLSKDSGWEPIDYSHSHNDTAFEPKGIPSAEYSEFIENLTSGEAAS